MAKALKTILLITIILIVNCEKEIPEDLHYLSTKEETVHLTKAPANSYLVMQFYNCENRKIDFNLEIGDIKNEYSFTEDVKFLYFPIENENIPKLLLKNNFEKLLRYSYSSENIFSFTPVLDKKIRATVNGRNIYFTFRNFALDVQNEYLILLVKNHNPKKINDLTNRCYIYKIMHGELNEKFLLHQFKSKTSQSMINMKYEIPSKDYEEYKNYSVVILGKETTNFKTEIIYQPIYIEIIDPNLSGPGKRPKEDRRPAEKKPEVKKSSFTMKLLPYCLFALFILIIYFVRYFIKNKFEDKKKYSRMDDNEIYV